MWALSRIALLTTTLSACSILAPSDDELLGGSKSDASIGTGGVAGSSGVGANAGAAGAAGSAGSAGSGNASSGGTAGSGGAAGSSGANTGGTNTGGASTGGTGGASTGGTGGASTGGTGGVATGGTGGTASGGTGGGTGGVSTVGCSDGSREAFKIVSQWPNVAGCDGGWTVPGVLSAVSMNPACNRNAGNSSSNPAGSGCSVADLCAPGWEVCPDRNTFDNKSPTGCALDFNTSLYLVRQGMSSFGTGCSFATSANNIIGCGQDLGNQPASSCSPLNTYMTLSACNADPFWNCGNDATNEGQNVVKSGPGHGGVICCKE